MFLFGLLIAGGEARPKDAQTWKQRKRVCELNECKEQTISNPNCVYRCVSPDCFREGFEEHPTGLLEPGEIDSQRDRLFGVCATRLDAQLKKQEQESKRAARQGKAQPTQV